MKHEMKLNNKPFEKIKKGTKTIELRLNDEKRQLLKVNDFIEFTNITNNEKLLVKIENLYDSYEIANPKDMEEYYSVEKQKQYGVVGIKIKKSEFTE